MKHHYEQLIIIAYKRIISRACGLWTCADSGRKAIRREDARAACRIATHLDHTPTSLYRAPRSYPRCDGGTCLALRCMPYRRTLRLHHVERSQVPCRSPAALLA